MSNPIVNRIKNLKAQVGIVVEKGEAFIQTIEVGTAEYII